MKQQFAKVYEELLDQFPGQVELLSSESISFGRPLAVAARGILPIVGIIAVSGMYILLDRRSLETTGDFILRWVASRDFLLIVLACGGIYFFSAVMSARERRRLYRAQSTTRAGAHPYVLFLRSFHTDIAGSDEAGFNATEIAVVRAVQTVSQDCAIVAVDSTLRKGSSGGALRVRIAHPVWRECVSHFGRSAAAIVLYAEHLSPGLAEELRSHIHSRSEGEPPVLVLLCTEKGDQCENVAEVLALVRREFNVDASEAEIGSILALLIVRGTPHLQLRPSRVPKDQVQFSVLSVFLSMAMVPQEGELLREPPRPEPTSDSL